MSEAKKKLLDLQASNNGIIPDTSEASELQQEVSNEQFTGEKPLIQQTKDELFESLKEEDKIAMKKLFDQQLAQAIKEKKGVENLNKSRVAVMCPVTEFINFRWVAQLWRLQRQSPPNTEFFPMAQYGVAYARERCVDQFCKLPPDFTHLLFIDTDIIPSDYALTTLLQDDKLIVSGIYANSLHTGLAAWNNEAALQYAQIQQTSPYDPLIQCDKVGMGFCLIHRDVFKMMLTIDKPWFFYKVDESGPHSEDFYFFSLVRRLGIKPFIDVRVQAMHMKGAVVNPNGGVGL